MSSIAELNQRFAIPGAAEIIAGEGGLLAVVVGNDGEVASGMVYLHGAHVAAWCPPEQQEVLFLSGKSAWEDGKPIRGGVPVIFPWFGPRKNPPEGAASPAHGFVRLVEWTLDAIDKAESGVTVTLSTRSNAATLATWPHAFLLRHRVTFGTQLTMALEVTNTGSAPFTAEEAQHTYFSLADVREARIAGLEGTTFIDKVDGMKQKTQDGPIAITGETDRIYVNTAAPVTIEDALSHRRIIVRKEHSRTTVVWNPWIAKAKAMGDFGPEEWPGMVCMETCNVVDYAVTLAPGQTHTMTTVVAAEDM